MKRPTTTVAGATLVFLRVAVGLLWGAELARNWDQVVAQTSVEVEGITAEEAAGLGLTIIIGTVVIVLAVELVLGILILLGHNWPRVVVMFFSVISISTAFVAWWIGELEITLTTGFLSAALDTLILLALSSRSAAAYARRNELR